MNGIRIISNPDDHNLILRHFSFFVLEIVANSICIIDEDREELLPLVHQSWQPLKLLFHSNNIFIVAKAFDLLHVFAECAKDFIHKRTLTDVFPPIMNYLKKLTIMAKDREMHQTLIARQSRLLLRKMVDGLWEFMDLLELGELESDPIIDQMIDFVNSSSELQVTYDNVAFKEPKHKDKIQQYYDPLRAMDSDILWLKQLRNKTDKTKE